MVRSKKGVVYGRGNFGLDSKLGGLKMPFRVTSWAGWDALDFLELSLIKRKFSYVWKVKDPSNLMLFHNNNKQITMQLKKVETCTVEHVVILNVVM